MELLRAWFAASPIWWQCTFTSTAASSSVVLAPLLALRDVYRPTYRPEPMKCAKLEKTVTLLKAFLA